jgi:hypothetical protein
MSELESREQQQRLANPGVPEAHAVQPRPASGEETRPELRGPSDGERCTRT